MKPRILVSARGKRTNYTDPVEHCGGIAILHTDQEITAEYDGLILCGGADIDPSYYGEEMNGTKEVNAPRDTLEFAMAKAFVEAGKPVLGICRGCQLLNVYFGGTLHQHLDNAEEHWGDGEDDLIHGATAEPGSIVFDLYGAEFQINSYHHQAIKTLGKGLWITNRTGDVIEGIEHESLPILAFQWHPERLSLGYRRQEAVDGIHIFRYFVYLCRKHMEN